MLHVEARCEAARTEQPFSKADPIVQLSRSLSYSVKSKTVPSFLICAAALLYLIIVHFIIISGRIFHRIRPIAVYTYIPASLPYMYNPLFKGTLHSYERAIALSLRFGFGAAAPEQQLYIIGKLPMIYNLFFCMPDTKEKKQMLKQKPPQSYRMCEIPQITVICL